VVPHQVFVRQPSAKQDRQDRQEKEYKDPDIWDPPTPPTVKKKAPNQWGNKPKAKPKQS